MALALICTFFLSACGMEGLENTSHQENHSHRAGNTEDFEGPAGSFTAELLADRLVLLKWPRDPSATSYLVMVNGKLSARFPASQLLVVVKTRGNSASNGRFAIFSVNASNVRSKWVSMPIFIRPETTPGVAVPVGEHAPFDDVPLVEEPAPIEEAQPVTEPTPIEETPPVEQPAPIKEAQPVTEPTPIEETPPDEQPTLIEEDPSVEEPAPIEEAPSAEEPARIEETPPVEEPAPIEETTPTEEPAPIKEAPPLEEPTPIADSPPVEELEPIEETPPVVQSAPFEEAPSVEEPVPVEEAPLVVQPAPIEEAPSVEEPAPVEEAPLVEETTRIEEAPPVEEPALIEEVSPIELVNLAPDITNTSYNSDPIVESVTFTVGQTDYFTLSVTDESTLTLHLQRG